MTPLEATTRARDAVLARMLPPATVRDVEDLVAVAEAAGGLCPRKGRALVGVLVRAGFLARVDPGRVVGGPRLPVRGAILSPFRPQDRLDAND